MTTDEDNSQPQESDQPVAPEIRPGRSLHWSWVWLVPLLALAVALSLLASVWVRTGPLITVSFASAAGIEAGQTKLRYRDVIVGEVKGVRMAQDRQHVLVDVQLAREGAGYITQKDAKFWIVRPRVGLTGVSGLDTLFSGVYISVDAPSAEPTGSAVTSFQGLPNPPEVLSGQVGTRFQLKSSSLGSLTVGSRVYYRRLEVGRVVNYEMTPDGRAISLQIFVEAPYDRYVTADTRFWNDSGVDMSLSPTGVQLRTSGLAAILNGGVAFAQADESSSYEGQVSTVPAAEGSSYTLFDTRDQALADPDGEPIPIELRFADSVRGLQVGAEVDYHGMSIGKVVDIDLELDHTGRRLFAKVRAQIYPMRFSQAYLALVDATNGVRGGALLQPLIQRGLRAQLRSASLLTGQQYVALDYFPAKASEKIQIPGDQNHASGYLIPTVPGDFTQLQRQLSSVVTKLDKLPIEALAQELQGSLGALHKLLRRLDTQLAPQASQTLESARRSLDRVGAILGPDAPMVGNLQETLKALDGAARGLRMLADALQAHPEALLRGPAPDRLR
ncbi:MAG: MlaD family protein [Castellaniella sp.]|uniref:PqiB family protein n=1 Tax=Castellaniella sp. TaxID=1955812 RepID=UPI003C71F93D